VIDLDRTPVVLIADGHPGRARQIVDALKDEPWDLRIISSEDSLLSIVDGHVPDVLLVAHDLGPHGGTATCRKIRERQENSRAQRVILLIDSPTPEQTTSAYDAGADDFLSQDSPNEETRSRVRAQVELVLAERRRVIAKLGLAGEFQELLEQAALGIGFARTSDGRFVSASPHLCEMLGYTRDELLQLSFHEIIDPVFFDDSIGEIDTLVSGARRYLVDDLKVTRKDGTSIWIQVTLSLVHDQETGIDYLVGLLEDISGRKEAQERLVLSDARFRDIAQTMAGWYWELDTEGRFTFASNRVSEYLGFTPEEMVGRMPGNLIVGEDAEEVARQFAHYVTSATQMHGLESWFAHRDGEPVCLVTNGLAMTDSETRIVGYRGVSQDVTEIKRAHALLRESEQRLKLATQGAKIGIWDWDVESDRMIWDGQMCRLHGTGPDTSITTSEMMLSTIGLDDRDRVRNAFRAVGSDNAALDVDCRLETADGSPKYVHMIADAVCDKAGHAVRVVGASWEITKQVVAEEELRRYHSELQDLVEAQTTELRSQMEKRLESDRSLRENMEELERFRKLATGRETRMIELKMEINGLLQRLDEDAKYKIVE
jgi:PAS domain S-box-containing protein